MSAPEALETIEFLIAGKRSIDTEKMYILKCLAAEDMSAEEFLNMLEELKYDVENIKRLSMVQMLYCPPFIPQRDLNTITS